MKRFATLKPLTTRSPQATAETFHRLAELLAGVRERGELHLQLITDGETESWTIDLGAEKPVAHQRPPNKPRLEIITRGTTWSEIAQGVLPPLQALVTGRLRVRGDVDLGLKLMRHLRGSEGAVDVCS